ncbi:hypothetical protein [Acinetobacter seifertii]|uniref:hypothetical protein n=1 Tax=Acinetobacter seifertii TaxID=1530123 RepID=UPI0032B4976A
MRIIIYKGLNNGYYVISRENAQKIPKETLNEIPENSKELFNGDTDLLYSIGVPVDVNQIKMKISKTELLHNLRENGFLKVVL